MAALDGLRPTERIWLRAFDTPPKCLQAASDTLRS
jgi:hypothetical protein